MINLVGKQAGQLIVILELQPIAPSQNRMFLCVCTCGTETVTQYGNLTSGHTKTCGCGTGVRQKHGHTSRQGKSRVYRIWSAMLSRCHRPTAAGYPKYGGAGIQVCDRWRFGDGARTGFECFLEDMGEPEKHLSIDRIDNLKGYFRDNCRWATSAEQLANRRNTIYLELDGIRRTLKQWANSLNVPYSRLLTRLNRGWSIRRTLTY